MEALSRSSRWAALSCSKLTAQHSQMAWKLARGKFRPRLQALVDSNADDSVQKCTTAGFAALKGTPEGAAPSDAALAAAVKAISALKVPNAAHAAPVCAYCC